MHRTSLASLTVVVALLAAAAAVAAGPELDPGLAKYAKVEGLRGTLNAAGSDTMLELQTLMAEDFRKLYPQVKIQVEGKGSSTAPPALIEGTVQLGNMSRAMKNQEIDAFEEKFGYEPTRFDVALDTLAVFVNKDNPVAALSLPQVDAIFSKTRKCGLRRRAVDLGPARSDRQTGRRRRSRSTAATRRRGPTATSRTTPCARATSRTP